MKSLSIIDNAKLPFLKYIREGIKTAEGRIATCFVRNLKIGEQLQLKSKTNSVVCHVTYLHFYENFRDMLINEKLENMVPFVENIDDAIKIYQSFPGSRRVNIFGCCAIGISYDSKLKNHKVKIEEIREF